MTLVELHKKDGSIKEVVRVLENGAETEVRVGRKRVYVDESGENTKVKIDSSPKDEDHPAFKINFTLDLCVNNFLED